MNRTWRGFVWVLLTGLCIWGLRGYFHARDERNRLDDAIVSEITAGLTIPLDCPPFAKQQVRFDSENSIPEIAEETMPVIVKRWGMLWPQAYSAISAEAKACGTKVKPGNDVKITVVLPASPMDGNPKWTIDVGDFSAELTGDKVTGASSY
jgi:hypothetical protein